LLEAIHADGTTIMMVTHDQELAGRAQRNIHLLDGRVAADELSPSEEEIPRIIQHNGAQPMVAQA